MTKSISIIHKDDNGNEVSNANHVVDLLFGIKTKNLCLKDEDVSADALFVLHKFTDFGNKWNDIILNKKDKSIFVFPTEISDVEHMKKTFSHKAIAKIIVSSEYYQKFFIKTLGFSASFIKLIQIPTKDYRPTQEKKSRPSKRVVLTAASVRPDKDFSSLIIAMAQLNQRYKDFHYILLLSRHPSITEEMYLSITQDMIDLVSNNSTLGNSISFITKQTLEYSEYLSLANLILYPYDKSNRMYLNSLFDGIVAHKPVVIPETGQTKDLIKRNIGGLLYQNDNIQSIVDACGLLLDNEDVSTILTQQNALISSNYLYANILPQYLNIFKRLKE